MEKIRILTDSGSDICAPYPENLTVIPLTIHFGDEEYLDGVTIGHRAFYEKLTSGKTLPTTSLVSPGLLCRCFRQGAGSRGDSGGCGAVQQAFRHLPERDAGRPGF